MPLTLVPDRVDQLYAAAALNLEEDREYRLHKRLCGS